MLVIILWLLTTTLLVYAAWKFATALLRLLFWVAFGTIRIIFWW